MPQSDSQKLLKIISCFVVIALLCIGFGAIAATLEPSIFKPLGEQYQPLRVQLEYVDDPSGTATIEQVSNGKLGTFRHFDTTKHNHDYDKQVLWLRFTADFSNFQDAYWFLTQEYKHAGEFSIFYPIDSGYKQVQLAADKPLSHRPFNVHNYLFKIPTPVTTPAIYYIRYAPQNHLVSVELYWSSIKGIIEYLHDSQFIFGICFGGLLVMWLYNSILFVYLRDRAYFFYSYYLGCLIAALFHTVGFAAIFFPQTPIIEKLFAFFGYGCVHGAILFGRYFLGLKHSLKKFDQILKVLQWLVVLSGISIFFLPILPWSALTYLSAPVAILLIVAGFIRIYQGYIPARIYVFGWIIVAVGLTFFNLKTLGILPTNLLTNNLIIFSALWETVLFALALAYRIKILETERNNALTQSNQELENKVHIRTQDLELSRNEILKSDTERKKLIHKINSLVEIERENIANEIHDELNATLIGVRLNSERVLELATQPEQNATINAEIKSKAEFIITLSKQLYSVARNIVRNLRPEILNMLGLARAIDEMINNFNAIQSECIFKFHAPANFQRLHNEMEIAVFRIVQESLSNIIKHAKASSASITLSINETTNALELVIVDNGLGFELKDYPGIGLIGMRERVYAFNGQIEILSKINVGTTISIRLPLSN